MVIRDGTGRGTTSMGVNGLPSVCDRKKTGTTTEKDLKRNENYFF